MSPASKASFQVEKDGVVWAWIAETARICAATAIFMVYLGLFILGDILFCTKVFCFHEAVNLIDVVRHFAQVNKLDMGIAE